MKYQKYDKAQAMIQQRHDLKQKKKLREGHWILSHIDSFTML